MLSENRIPRTTIAAYHPPSVCLHGGGNAHWTCEIRALETSCESIALRGPPFWQRLRGRRVARLVVVAGYIYVATFLVLLTLEDRLLFPGATIARSWCEPPDYLRVREIGFDSAAGDNIHAWFTVPEGWTPRQGVSCTPTATGAICHV